MARQIQFIGPFPLLPGDQKGYKDLISTRDYRSEEAEVGGSPPVSTD